MLPAVGAALITAGGNLAGDIFNQVNARSAFKHRYQDTVADMRKAGLNPALAYGQGGGNPQTAEIGDIGSQAVDAYNKVASAKQAAATTDLTKSQADLLKAQTGDLVEQQKLRNYLLNADINLRGEQLSNLNVDTSAKTIKRDRDMATFDSDVQGRKAGNTIRRLAVPQAAALAKWFRAHPDLAGWLNSAGGITSFLRAIPQIPME